MKKSKLIVILLLLVCFITACGKSDKKFNVTFNYDDGTVNTVEVYENQTVSKPANPTKEGYTFLGWYVGEEEFDFSSKITKDVTLTAKWSINTGAPTMWTIKFNTNGGTPIEDIEVLNGSTVSLTNLETTKTGYKFLGWYSGEEEFDFSTKITKNITLVAKWEKIEEKTKYTVTFDSASGSKVNAQYVVENGTAKQPADPKRTGYTFKGWYLGETAYNFGTKVTKNITLVAKWEENAPTYSYKWVEVENSDEGQYTLYLTKTTAAGKTTYISGTATLTNIRGKSNTVSIPATGLMISYKDQIESITNIKES